MAMYFWLIISMSVLIIIPDVWFYVKMKKHRFFRWFRVLSLVPGILFILSFFYIKFVLVHNDNDYLISTRISWIFIALSIIYIPKLLYIIFSYINRLFNHVFHKKTKIFHIVGYAISILSTAFLLYGVIVTRDNFKFKEQVVEVKNLPDGFDGYRIALIADFHLGNWNKKYEIMKPIINMINASNPDIIILAGDIINNFHQETEGWEGYFHQLKSRQGNFAVLGNHDYGDYTTWKTPEDKITNLEKSKENIRNLGFRLLLNENTELVNKGDTITLVGVENYGSGHFHNYCNLTKALENTRPNRQKILITHNPNHWNDEVVGKKKDIFLSLAGHTHAGQLGYSTNKFQFSIASFIYPRWDGLYQKDGQYLYVNRGIGYVGMPIRLGVPPEITLVILKKAP